MQTGSIARQKVSQRAMWTAPTRRILQPILALCLCLSNGSLPHTFAVSLLLTGVGVIFLTVPKGEHLESLKEYQGNVCLFVY